MSIKFCRKLIILASFLFVLGFAQTQVFADDSSNSNSSVISDDTSKAIDDASKQAEKAVSEVTNDAEKKSGDTSSASDYTEDVIKSKLSQPDMDWVNSHILQNYKFYHQDSSLTDVSSGAAHIVTDLFTAINLNIVYPLFDKALSTMFNLTGITNGINGVLTSVGQYSNKAWQSDALKGLLYLAFGVGLVWTFAKSIKSGGGLKSILTIVVIAVVGSAWVGAGSTVLSKINTLTSNAQTAVFVSTSDIKGAYSDTGDSFQNTLRYSYFEQAVERPFLLGNYGVATMSDAEKGNDKMGNPYRLIGGNVTDDVLAEFAKNNSYIKKKGGQEWYQVAIAFMSPVMSFAYGVPLLMVGLANLLVQLGAILLYYLAPFTIMISLIPKFANSALKTAMGALGLLFSKVGLLFGIMFITWVGNVTDTVVPPVDSASSMLNSIVYIVLMILLWKNKSWLVQTITGSSVANNAMNKISMTRAGRKALGTANEMRNSASRMYQGARNGIKRGKDMKDKHSDEFDDDALRDEIEQEEQAKRKQARKDFLSKDMAKHQAQVKKDRASRLKNAMPNQDTSYTSQTKDYGVSDNTGTHRAIADEVTLPRYQRSKELKQVPDTPDSATESKGRPSSKSYETGSKEAQTRREARSKVLKSKEDTKNFNQRLHADDEQRKQNKQDLDKELR